MPETIRVKEDEGLKGKQIEDEVMCKMIIKGIEIRPDYGNSSIETSKPGDKPSEPKEATFYTLEYDSVEGEDDSKASPDWFERAMKTKKEEE